MSTKVKCFGSSHLPPLTTSGGRSSSTSQGKCRAIAQTLGVAQSGLISSISSKTRSVMLASTNVLLQRKSRNA
jgi:hypothetical protein